jgi:hypothetical protein
MLRFPLAIVWWFGIVGGVEGNMTKRKDSTMRFFTKTEAGRVYWNVKVSGPGSPCTYAALDLWSAAYVGWLADSFGGYLSDSDLINHKVG